MKILNQFRPVFLASLVTVGMVTPVTTSAIPYSVIPHWVGSGSTPGLLTGTLDIPLGDYVIINNGPNPFSNINLTIAPYSGPANLTQLDTSGITGTGEFLIHATPLALIFETANADEQNQAYLNFRDTMGEYYAIGTGPRNEEGYSTAHAGGGDTIDFPFVFATIAGSTSVPEAVSTFWLLGISLLVIVSLRTFFGRTIQHR